ncbi:homeobox-leucine zipper protein ROC8-like [Magnolia sinica]|uniref:homeobox-leucine zipper protein ROC8-like n=1 Tax=Magnolia sinica TaxID=86752 RepID=UPI00265890EA|nr:homeobox-leucine zipper protein ROC8-like [Magnolia sinica]
MYSNGLVGFDGGEFLRCFSGEGSSKKSLTVSTSGMEGGSSGGGPAAGGGGSGDDPDVSDPSRKKKRYHRHTARQIQELESTFKECPHPDEKQRLQLSRDLGLEPRQIKFWFQNRRTQMKAQHERADNCSLRAENDKIRCENIAIREALKNVICPSCGGPPVGEDMYFDEQKLRIENARLKEELDRVSSIAAKYIGRPISHLPPIQPVAVSSLDLSMGSFSGAGMGPSLDLDLLPGSSSISPMPLQMPGISEMEKSLMAEIAANGMDELIRLLQTDEPLWMKSTSDGRDILNLESYERMFPKPNLKNPDVRIEASRDSGLVIMNGLALVDMFMDSSKWIELFPTIVSKARTIEVLASGMSGSRSGSLQLMHEELQVLSPLISTREFYFIRYCQQIEQGLWAIVDVSFDISRVNQFISPSRSRRRPSGCFIQDMPNGYSKVTWVEHVEIEEKTPAHRLYRELINSGMAFGAQRWMATLQRMCERFACLMVSNSSSRELGGVIPSADGRRSMMKLSQRMINSFCSSISASNGHRWTTLSGMNDVGVRVTVHKSTDPGQPNGVVLSAASSIWLPVSPQDVFNFFRDERTRALWDVLSNGNSVQEVAHIANGSHPGNCISVLRAFNASQNNMLILQESCTDSSGSLVVYAPVDLPAINIAMSGEDPSYIPLLPSGFTILPDGRPDNSGAGPSTSSNLQGNMPRSSGSLITVAFQILVSSLPSAKLNLESVTTVNNLISTTVQQIKSALNCT